MSDTSHVFFFGGSCVIIPIALVALVSTAKNFFGTFFSYFWYSFGKNVAFKKSGGNFTCSCLLHMKEVFFLRRWDFFPAVNAISMSN